LGKIKKLDESVFQKIAAGEVVERPLSVVKELVENSLDSGANYITVELIDAGKSSIIIKDNGEGFAPDDMEQAFKRHSTSKFTKITDFDSLDTLGFRGEALPSIREVSLIELKTSNNDTGKGLHIIFDGNKTDSINEISFNRGSEIIVKELFYNFPVRKKFLKTDRTELNQIVSFFEQAAIVNFKVTFKIINNNKVIFNYNRVNSLKERIYQIFGREFTNKLKELNYSAGDYKISGFVSNINTGSATKKKQFFFVNKRVIREKTLIASFNNSFRKFLEKGKFPNGILLLSAPAKDIDVNIHPMKLEIKFRDSSFIYNFIKHGIETVFEEEYKNYENSDNNINFASKPVQINSHFIFNKNINDNNHNLNSNENDKNEIRQIPLFTSETINTDSFKLIGQYKNSYILIEKDDELVLVDQHNGHERHNFDKLKENYSKKKPESATPLFPVIIELSHTEMHLLDEKKMDILKQTGFELIPYSRNSYNIKAFPSILNERDLKDTILKLLYIEDGKDSFEDKIFAEIACKSAIKINHPLQPEEMKIIVRNLYKSSNPYFCPHGRPIIIKFTLEYIEKQLKRR